MIFYPVLSYHIQYYGILSSMMILTKSHPHLYKHVHAPICLHAHATHPPTLMYYHTLYTHVSRSPISIQPPTHSYLTPHPCTPLIHINSTTHIQNHNQIMCCINCIILYISILDQYFKASIVLFFIRC